MFSISLPVNRTKESSVTNRQTEKKTSTDIDIIYIKESYRLKMKSSMKEDCV